MPARSALKPESAMLLNNTPRRPSQQRNFTDSSSPTSILHATTTSSLPFNDNRGLNVDANRTAARDNNGSGRVLFRASPGTRLDRPERLRGAVDSRLPHQQECRQDLTPRTPDGRWGDGGRNAGVSALLGRAGADGSGWRAAETRAAELPPGYRFGMVSGCAHRFWHYA